MSLDLAEHVVVVTGGSGTLGSAIATVVATEGASVAVLGRNPQRTNEVANRITADGGSAVAVIADVTDEPGLQDAAKRVQADLGRVTGLVNCAGGHVANSTVEPEQSPMSVDPTAWREAVELNLLGTVLPTRVFGAAMNGTGSIVNISSMSARRTLTKVPTYSAAKAAVDSHTRSLAVEMARRYGDKFRVNAVAPGFIVADTNRSLLIDSEGQLSERGATIIGHTPAGRFGHPDEVAEAVAWLLSDRARFVTGAIIPVDGGFDAFSGV